MDAAERSEREKKVRTEARRAERVVGAWREGAGYGYRTRVCGSRGLCPWGRDHWKDGSCTKPIEEERMATRLWLATLDGSLRRK